MLKCLRIASFKEFFWIVEREVFLSLMRSKLRAVFVPFGGQKVTWGRARRTELQKRPIHYHSHVGLIILSLLKTSLQKHVFDNFCIGLESLVSTESSMVGFSFPKYKYVGSLLFSPLVASFCFLHLCSREEVG